MTSNFSPSKSNSALIYTGSADVDLWEKIWNIIFPAPKKKNDKYNL